MYQVSTSVSGEDLIPWACLGVAILAAQQPITSRRFARKMLAWQRVEAVVTKSTAYSASASEGQHDGWRTKIEYSFEVDGEVFTGQRYSVNGAGYFSTREAVDLFLVPYAEGEEIHIFYDPKQPSRNIIKREHALREDLLPMFVALMALLCFVISIVA